MTNATFTVTALQPRAKGAESPGPRRVPAPHRQRQRGPRHLHQ